VPIALCAGQGDERLYSRYKPPDEAPFYVQCEATKLAPDGITLRCEFIQREDSFRKNIRHRKHHTYVFPSEDHRQLRQRRLDEMELDVPSSRPMPEIAKQLQFSSRDQMLRSEPGATSHYAISYSLPLMKDGELV
jgi:hypothetical protein